MDASAIVEKLAQRFGARITGRNLETLDPWVEVQPQALVEVCRWLRDEPSLDFKMLHCVTGVDYLQVDPKRKAEFQPHVEVIYHLSSLTHRHRLVVKVLLPRWKNDRPGLPPEAPSVSGVWRTADWHEREVFDLSGVRFTGHPDLRRILCPEDWAGYPLRKDYEMPAEYHGIKAR
jgi:NADH-quinone oxidoreductase subunit C